MLFNVDERVRLLPLPRDNEGKKARHYTPRFRPEGSIETLTRNVEKKISTANDRYNIHGGVTENSDQDSLKKKELILQKKNPQVV